MVASCTYDYRVNKIDYLHWHIVYLLLFIVIGVDKVKRNRLILVVIASLFFLVSSLILLNVINTTKNTTHHDSTMIAYREPAYATTFMSEARSEERRVGKEW